MLPLEDLIGLSGGEQLVPSPLPTPTNSAVAWTDDGGKASYFETVAAADSPDSASSPSSDRDLSDISASVSPEQLWDHPWDALYSDASSDEGTDSLYEAVPAQDQVASIEPLAYMDPATIFQGLSSYAVPIDNAISDAASVAMPAKQTSIAAGRQRRRASTPSTPTPPPTSTPSRARKAVMVRAGSIEVREDELLDLDLDALQRIAGQRISKTEQKELKRLRRKLKNKLSAANSRQKKREYMSDLEVKTNDLHLQIERLRNENEALRKEVATLRSSWPAHAPPPAIAPHQSLATGALSGRQAGAMLFAILLSFAMLFDARLFSVFGGAGSQLTTVGDNSPSPFSSSFESPYGDASHATSRKLLVVSEAVSDGFVDAARAAGMPPTITVDWDHDDAALDALVENVAHNLTLADEHEAFVAVVST